MGAKVKQGGQGEALSGKCHNGGSTTRARVGAANNRSVHISKQGLRAILRKMGVLQKTGLYQTGGKSPRCARLSQRDERKKKVPEED